MSDLLPRDFSMFHRFKILPELLAKCKIQRVSDAEARDILGPQDRGDLSGILFPYYSPETNFRVGARVRRDNHEWEDNKPRNKYKSGYGDRKHLYLPLVAVELLADLTVPIILVEAEKSALALWAWAERTGKRIVPVGLGGCWGWRGRIGIVENANGERVEEVGPIPDLRWCAKRRTYILLDANCSTNPNVQAARRELAKALGKMRAEVRILDLPVSEGINGPDDFLAVNGDQALAVLFDAGGIVARKDGKPRNLLVNALVLLRESPEWHGVLAFNEFSWTITTQKPAPWQTEAGADWTDYDDSKTTEWLQRHDVLVPTVVTNEAVRTIAKESPFHPVRTYLEGLVWDQTSRLDQWLNRYLGVPDSAYVRAVGSRWMISGVARIFAPGCQVDHTLMLEGDQGLRKSSALRILASDKWFRDHGSDLKEKDARLELRGVWIFEFSEMSQLLRHGQLEHVKSFLTNRFDDVRPPYERHSQKKPRSTVFAASTNADTPFVDPTGNRRFWPVRCNVLDLAALERDRDQLWAEAYVRYRADEPWWLDTEELNRAAALEQNKRYEPGVWDEIILAWIENPTQRSDSGRNNEPIPIEPFSSDETRVTITDVLLHGIGKPLDRLTQADRTAVAKCLQHAGWTPAQDRRRGPSRNRRFYVRPPLDEEEERLAS